MAETAGTVGAGAGQPPQGQNDALYLPIMQQGQGIEDLGEAIQDLADRALTATDITSSFVKAFTTFFNGKGKKFRGGATDQDKQILKSGGNKSNSPGGDSPMDKKLKMGWHRLFQTKWFDNTLKGLKGIMKAMGSIFMDLLEFFLVMAFLDPSGGFLKSIIKMLMGFAVMLIKIIIKLLPDAIAMMLDVAIMVVKAIIQIMPELLGALMASFTKLGDKFPLLKPFLKPLIDIMGALKKFFVLLNAGKIKEAFIGLGKDLIDIVIKTLPVIIEYLGKGLGLIFGVIGQILTWDNIKKAFSIIYDVLVGTFDAISKSLEDNFGASAKRKFHALAIVLGIVLVAFLAFKIVMLVLAIKAALATLALMGLTLPLILIGLAVLALIAVFLLLYIYWDDVVAFFSNIGAQISAWFIGAWDSLVTTVTGAWSRFKNWVIESWNSLGENLKTALMIIGGLILAFLLAPLLLILAPILLVGLAIYLLIKHWDSIKIFFMKTLPKMFSDGWKKLKSYLSGLLGDFGFLVDSITQGWSRFIAGVKTALMNSLSSALTFGTDMWDGIKGGFSRLIQWIEDMLGAFITRVGYTMDVTHATTKADVALGDTTTRSALKELLKNNMPALAGQGITNIEELAKKLQSLKAGESLGVSGPLVDALKAAVQGVTDGNRFTMKVPDVLTNALSDLAAASRNNRSTIRPVDVQ